MDIAARKKELRKHFLELRMQLDEEYWAKSSGKIMARWLTGFHVRNLHLVHIFLSMKEKNEVNTQEFLDEFTNNLPWLGVCIPVMEPGSKVLKHVQLSKDVIIEENSWGVPEPVSPQRFIHPKEIDMVIVPLLAFDLAGNRLGYGGGYYDQFLSNLRPGVPKIGVGFEVARSGEILPTDEWDVKLDGMVTEERVYYFDPKLIKQ